MSSKAIQYVAWTSTNKTFFMEHKYAENPKYTTAPAKTEGTKYHICVFM